MTKLVVLVILDGWGIAPAGPGNAVELAETPVFDALWERYPHTTLRASGAAVGLPPGQMGNSEVGHLTIGSGRILFQNLARVNQAVADGSRLLRPCQLGDLTQVGLQLLETRTADGDPLPPRQNSPRPTAMVGATRTPSTSTSGSGSPSAPRTPPPPPSRDSEQRATALLAQGQTAAASMAFDTVVHVLWVMFMIRRMPCQPPTSAETRAAVGARQGIGVIDDDRADTGGTR